MAILKLICLAIFTICAIIIFLMPRVISEKREPNNNRRVRLIVKIRMIAFLVMLVMLFICVIF